ncbi:hypothetical protein PQQ20_11420 [Methanosarcina mazei]|jgi:hypothetical protein|nr:hypothetical protein [Methanosarcina mazei]WIM42266.1 hypothetical protein PSF70_12140 [Methanosarcina mazei]WIM45603.1 hypothetical protein PQQ20_11420 [Methanosarcina mazei]
MQNWELHKRIRGKNMHITSKTETEDTIFEFTLSLSGSPKSSFNQTLVYILRGKDGLDFAEIEISQIITRTGNFNEKKISQWYIEEPGNKKPGENIVNNK